MKSIREPVILCAMVAALVVMPSSRGEEEEPPYPHGEWVEDCTMCHRSDGWTPVEIGPEFDHGEYGRKLEASHGRADCRACHLSLQFARVETDCVGCHSDVHQSELGTDCGRCHTPRSFVDRIRMQRAHLATRFPLRGAHRLVDCEACHQVSAQGSHQYVSTPVECEACHLAEFNATVDPDHAASGFSTDCRLCHSTFGWVPAGFNHSVLPPGAACVDCHLDDFLATSAPNHSNVGFPQECELCHSTRRWVPAANDGFNHDGLFFPIYSGKHRGKWSTCNECHLNPANFAQFSCIDCHEHGDRNDVDDEHQDVPDYSYDSQSCFDCHPNGDER